MRTTLGVPFPGSPEELAAFQESETASGARSLAIAGMKEP